jgi:redox-sensing transcriptional repressor
VLSVPEGVDVRKVDLSTELQILAFHEQRKSGGLTSTPRPDIDRVEEVAG